MLTYLDEAEAQGVLVSGMWIQEYVIIAISRLPTPILSVVSFQVKIYPL